jgi:hypothetical protein
MDHPISREEVLLAVRKLKNGKAPGPDRIIGEMLKYAGDRVIDFFVKLVNTLFDRGIFPDNWTDSIVLPLLKTATQITLVIIEVFRYVMSVVKYIVQL